MLTLSKKEELIPKLDFNLKKINIKLVLQNIDKIAITYAQKKESNFKTLSLIVADTFRYYLLFYHPIRVL